jgi:hypothetical protein
VAEGAKRGQLTVDQYMRVKGAPEGSILGIGDAVRYVVALFVFSFFCPELPSQSCQVELTKLRAAMRLSCYWIYVAVV